MENTESGSSPSNLQTFLTKAALESKKIALEIGRFLLTNKEFVLAVTIALVSLVYFLVTAHSTLFEEFFPGFRIRIFGLTIASIVLIMSLLAVFTTPNNLTKKIFLFLQSLFILFFSYSYFLGIENRVFYPIILAVLPAFIFVIHVTLFTGKWVNIYTTLAQIFLFVLQTFSLLTFFDVDRVVARSFSQDALSIVFNLPEFFWLTICAIAISVVSLNYFKIQPVKLNLYIFGLLFWLVIQVLYFTQAISFQNFFYWEKTLVFLIMWDFLLVPMMVITNRLQDDKYKPRLLVSTGYHLFLLIIVFVFTLLKI